ncbi:MAG: hypothetical protein Q4C77_18350 [Eubacteriales bacterium]|nr:hypothetical protein [Eubacteriales bacterium]
MIIGILLISICVACYRLSSFGVDSFTGMNLGISGFLGMSFGTWQLIANFLILIVVFFTVRHCIGLGTVVNMVCVGYIADFLCWLVNDAAGIEMTLPLRILALLLGTLFASLGVALYMKADMGISPYDSVALIITKLAKEKIPFQYARISSDITALLIGVLFCLAAKGNIWTIIGIGTVCNSLFNGPLIQFFRGKIDQKILL